MKDFKQCSLDDRHITIAGKVMREIRKGGEPRDAQVIFALMSVYFCQQQEILVDNFISALVFNMQGFAKDEALYCRILEQIHKEVSPTGIVVPVSYAGGKQ